VVFFGPDSAFWNIETGETTFNIEFWHPERTLKTEEVAKIVSSAK
jgi:hypothetical protein